MLNLAQSAAPLLTSRVSVCVCVCVFQLPVEAAYLYDAVWIYARAAHAVVARGYDPSDGRRILDNIRGTTYKSRSSGIQAGFHGGR